MLIQAYNPQWPQWFERIQAILAAALQGLDHSIEHVGSTAVPGLAAKPIIDIDIVYPPPPISKPFKNGYRISATTTTAIKVLRIGRCSSGMEPSPMLS